MKKLKWDTSRTSPPVSQSTASDNAHATKLIICRTAEVGNQSCTLPTLLDISHDNALMAKLAFIVESKMRNQSRIKKILNS